MNKEEVLWDYHSISGKILTNFHVNRIPIALKLTELKNM